MDVPSDELCRRPSPSPRSARVAGANMIFANDGGSIGHAGVSLRVDPGGLVVGHKLHREARAGGLERLHQYLDSIPDVVM